MSDYLAGLRNILSKETWKSIDINKDNQLSKKEIKSALDNTTNTNLSTEGRAFLDAIINNPTTPNMYENIKNIETHEVLHIFFSSSNADEITKSDLYTLRRATDENTENDKYYNGEKISPNKDDQTIIDKIENYGKNINEYMNREAIALAKVEAQVALKKDAKNLVDYFSDIGTKGESKGKLLPSRDNLPVIRDVMFRKTDKQESYDIATKDGSQFIPNLTKALTILGFSPESKSDTSVKEALKKYQTSLINNNKLKTGQNTGKFGYNTWKNMVEDLSKISGENLEASPPFRDLGY